MIDFSTKRFPPFNGGTNNSVPYSPRNKWKASVIRQGDIIIKDYGANPFIPRLYGRICIGWEAKALEKLQGLEGIPALIGRPNPYMLKMATVPGIPISKIEEGSMSELYFERLVALFHAIHARGVAHGDAHQRNILIHNDFPYLVDFSTAYVKGRVPVLDNYVFRCFVLLDLERLYKVEKRFFGRGRPPRMFLLYRLLKRTR